jgi:hypothetical protein
VDDADLMYRNGLYWLYYKGRGRVDGSGSPVHTQMGTSFSKYPDGPFTKRDHPILSGSHEVMLWRQGLGVGALAALSSTFEYAPDGIDFMSNKMEIKVEDHSIAMGVFRPDLIDCTISNAGPHWGISMIVNGYACYLISYKLVAN